MIKIIFLAIFIIAILHLLKKKSKSSIYGRLIFLIIIVTILFIVATYGKYILPQILQILKITLPFIAKFISL
jgi:hypothetical protein